jgi:hypothetical protein
MLDAPQPQREWVRLTDEEIESVNSVGLHSVDWDNYEVFQPSVKDFAHAIEAKLREKNGGGA